MFEAELTFEVKNEDGQPVRFGSVGGGGRYDDLVERFTGQNVPATGFSIGVSRLQAALAALNKDKPAAADGPVVVLVMDKDRLPRYQKMTQTLRQAGIRAEMYLGTAGMKAQMKYADKRGAPCVVIQGGDERAKGEVQIKDLIEGAKAAATIKDSKEWREGRPAQVSVPEADLVAEVRRSSRAARLIGVPSSHLRATEEADVFASVRACHRACSGAAAFDRARAGSFPVIIGKIPVTSRPSVGPFPGRRNE